LAAPLEICGSTISDPYLNPWLIKISADIRLSRI